VAEQLRQAWDTGNVSRASGIALKSGSQLATTAKPHGLVQKLAYKADGFLVSQISKLQPSDLKDSSSATWPHLPRATTTRRIAATRAIYFPRPAASTSRSAG
jgi:hypothetical protein